MQSTTWGYVTTHSTWVWELRNVYMVNTVETQRVISSAGEYNQGDKNGTWMSYYENGSLKISYVNGGLEGHLRCP